MFSFHRSVSLFSWAVLFRLGGGSTTLSALLYVVAIGVSVGGIWYEKKGRRFLATTQVKRRICPKRGRAQKRGGKKRGTADSTVGWSVDERRDERPGGGGEGKAVEEGRRFERPNALPF